MKKNNTVIDESVPYQMDAVMSDNDVATEEAKLVSELTKHYDELTYSKSIIVKFRCERDANNFCSLIQQNISYSDKSVVYRSVNEASGEKFQFFGDTPKRTETNRDKTWLQYWKEMPSF